LTIHELYILLNLTVVQRIDQRRHGSSENGNIRDVPQAVLQGAPGILAHREIWEQNRSAVRYRAFLDNPKGTELGGTAIPESTRFPIQVIHERG